MLTAEDKVRMLEEPFGWFPWGGDVEAYVRRMARRAGLRLRKSRVRRAGHPAKGKYWLVRADNGNPVDNYQGYAYLTLERAGAVIRAFDARRAR